MDLSKVEAGIQDDPRNPATIDNVGDNVVMLRNGSRFILSV
jgi:Na+/H+-translocating membrane pyrophosphatase